MTSPTPPIAVLDMAISSEKSDACLSNSKSSNNYNMEGLPDITTSLSMEATYPAPTTPELDPSPLTTPESRYAEPHYETPLYTEINIPLPTLPQSSTSAVEHSSAASSKPTGRRKRAHTLHSISPFHKSHSSSPEGAVKQQQQNHQHPNHHGLSLRTLAKGRSRSGTIEAAIVPAVLVLKAELFTPGHDDH
jgi:hypothetical protein